MKRLLTFSNLAIVLLFFLALNLLIFSSLKNSPTTDESIHLFAGYTYLTKHDFRLDPEHPPLLKELASLPLLFNKNLNLPFDGLWDKSANFYYDSWKEARKLGETFLFGLGNDTGKILFWSRFPFIVLTMLLGWGVYFWAKKLYGKKAGIFAAFLVLLMPNILAHGILINTDLGLTVFAFFGIYFWGEFLKKSTWKNLLWSTLFFGLALASKYTAVIFIPVIIALIFTRFFLNQSFKDWKNYLLGFLGMGLGSFVIVWATYGFKFTPPPVPIGSFSQNIQMWADYNIPTFFDGVFNVVRPWLVPADFYKGLILVLRHALGGHDAFLLGQNSPTGWWYYFPAIFFFKTPAAFFAFLALAIAYFKKTRAKLLFDELLLIVPIAIYLALSMFSKADLGIRHIFPVLPFLIVFASKSINLVSLSSIRLFQVKIRQIIPALGFVILILWFFLSSVSGYPNYLSYFNEAAGGPKNGYKVATDSNLDWGQDIYRIQDYVKNHNLENIRMVYPWDGLDSMQYYGLNYPILQPEETGFKGTVIISATYLQTEAYGWLKQYQYSQITPGVFIVLTN